MRRWVSAHPLLTLFLLALALRCGAYIFFNLLLFGWEFEHPDSVWYDTVGRDLVGSSWTEKWAWMRVSPYVGLVGAVYDFLLPHRFLLELLNMLASAGVACLAYRTVLRLTNREKGAWGAGLLVAFDPYQIYLSTQLLRDSLIVIAYALALYALFSRRAVLLGFGLLTLGLLRFLLIPVTFPVFLAYLLRHRLIRLALVSYVPVCLVLLLMWGPGLLAAVRMQVTYVADPPPANAQPGDVNPATGRKLVYEGEVEPTVAHTEFYNDRPLYTFQSLVTGRAPLGDSLRITLESFFYPYPWTADNGYEAAFASYMLFWYGVAALILLALSSAYLRTAGWLLVAGGILCLFLGFTIPGTGPLVRWRVPAVYTFLLSGGAALVFLPTPKRVFDVLLALLLLLVTAPAWLLVSGFLLATRRKILFRQTRVGLNGVPFSICKFVTMAEGSEGQAAREGVDRRITRLGHLLRATALDELPELLNVLKGDMSIVGPRPHAWWERLEDSDWEKRYAVKPGLMGLAQCKCHRSDLQTKLRYDLEYIETRSFWLDLKLVALGVWTSLRRQWV